MLKIAKENHLALFDAKQQCITAYTFQIVLPESKKSQGESKPELKEQYSVSLYILDKFEYTWTSDIFDMVGNKN